jgi:hypothetical protein
MNFKSLNEYCNTPNLTFGMYWIRLCINYKCVVILMAVKPYEL